jgi:hypothetical protein
MSERQGIPAQKFQELAISGWRCTAQRALCNTGEIHEIRIELLEAAHVLSSPL